MYRVIKVLNFNDYTDLQNKNIRRIKVKLLQLRFTNFIFEILLPDLCNHNNNFRHVASHGDLGSSSPPPPPKLSKEWKNCKNNESLLGIWVFPTSSPPPPTKKILATCLPMILTILIRINHKTQKTNFTIV